MSTIQPSNSNIIPHLSPYKLTIHSASDLQRLSLKRSQPISLEFRLEENIRINPSLSKKLTNFFSKKTLKLKNPPIKECLDNGNLTRHIRSLQVRPKEAAKYITRITKNFSKVNKFAIVDEHDVFVPIRIKKKVQPMRMLRSFIYNHEYCKDFLRCARYASEVRIRKMSLDVTQLKRLQRLEKLHLILKTKYLNLPDEDTIFVRDLGKTLLQLPHVGHVALEQEIDPETNPYTFLDLQQTLQHKAKVHLIADFVDVSSQRNKAFSVEKILHTISSSGIEHVNIKYVGVAQAMNRYGRSFYAPLHIKSDLYVRFLKTVMTVPFENVKFAPIVHSSYFDKDLKENLISLLKSNKKLEIPRLNLVYNLDMAELTNIDLMRDLYNQGARSYEVALISMGGIRRGLVEKLQEHFSAALAQIEKSKAELSLQIVTKNLSTLENVVEVIVPKLEGMVIRGISVHIKDPIDKASLYDLVGLLKNSRICSMSKAFEIDFTQKEFPKEEELYSFCAGLAQGAEQLGKMTLSYHNTRECEETIKRACEKLRSQYRRTEFEYEINSEKKIYE